MNPKNGRLFQYNIGHRPLYPDHRAFRTFSPVAALHRSSRFYAHRFKNGTYKVGTYKCMDIVYGNKKKNIYFGILIRSIEDIETGEFYCGPCVSVNKLLGYYKVKEFNDFFEDYNIDEEFTLEETDDLDYEDIYVGPRVGLGDKYPEFKNKEYRYAIKIKKIKKQKIFRLLHEDSESDNSSDSD